MSKTAFHSGDLGDSIFGIPAFKSLGITHVYFGTRPWTKPGLENRVQGIVRLFKAQGITISMHEGEEFDYDFSTFRNGGQLNTDTIALRHARWAGVTLDLSKPWLVAETDERTKGRILISRGPRWQGYWFPWRQLVNTFRSKMVFVGLDEDYQDFVKKYGSVERIKTDDLYDVAKLINGCSLFIANQSSPNAICEGLQKDNILEVCLHAPDCIYFRKNSKYVIDGSLEFEFHGIKFRSERFSEGVDVHKPTPNLPNELHQLERMERMLAKSLVTPHSRS